MAYEAAFYDEAYADPQHRARRPLEESPWRPLYEAAALRISATADVVDLGCGTGRFARLLHDRGHAGSYLGIDFSPVAVEEARRYCPEARYLVGDLRTCPLPVADVYVLLEVLEHLDDDLGLIRRLPPGRLIFSVPNYGSVAHVRHFASRRHAAARYKLALPSLWERQPPPPAPRYAHLFSGRSPA